LSLVAGDEPPLPEPAERCKHPTVWRRAAGGALTRAVARRSGLARACRSSWLLRLPG